jgi:O-antigen/teichoic acid export membrane protein
MGGYRRYDSDGWSTAFILCCEHKELRMSGIRRVVAQTPASLHPQRIAVSAPRTVGVRRLTRGVTVLSVLSIGAGVLNYGSNVFFARILKVSDYGDLSSLLSLFVVISVPLAAAQTRVAERTAAYTAAGEPERVRYLIRHAQAHMATLGIGATLLYCALIPLIVSALSLTNAMSAVALAAMIFMGFMFPALQGALQGLERWVAFGVVGLGMGAGRLAFGVPLALLTHGAGGAIAGQAVGMLFVLAAVAWLLRAQLRRGGGQAARAGMRRVPDIRAVSAGGAFVLFAVIANCDVVFAKLWMPPGQAGHYAALATIGRIITYLPAAVAVVVVPSAAATRGNPERRARVLRSAALLVGGISLLAMIPAVLAPHLLVGVMFGHKYAAIASGVFPIVIAGGGLALLYLLVTYSVVIDDRRLALLLMFGVVMQATGIALFHADVTQVATVQATTVMLLLLINELGFHALIPRRQHA